MALTLPPVVTAKVKPPPQATPFTLDFIPAGRPSAPRASLPVPNPPRVSTSLQEIFCRQDNNHSEVFVISKLSVHDSGALNTAQG